MSNPKAENNYSKLRPDAQQEMCLEFGKIYKAHTEAQIHLAFLDIDPIVTWDNDNFTGYHVWEAYKPKFENILFNFCDMNDITKTPAAELVGEYNKVRGLSKSIHSIYSNTPAKKLTQNFIDNFCEKSALYDSRAAAIAQELDRRCEAAGISLKGHCFVFTRIRRNGDDVYIGQGHADDVGGSELHALLGWLLMKGGQGL